MHWRSKYAVPSRYGDASEITDPSLNKSERWASNKAIAWVHNIGGIVYYPTIAFKKFTNPLSKPNKFKRVSNG